MSLYLESVPYKQYTSRVAYFSQYQLPWCAKPIDIFKVITKIVRIIFCLFVTAFYSFYNNVCYIYNCLHICVFSSVQSLSHVWLFVTPWTAALQASLSITNFRTLLKPTSIESVMSSNHLILCHPLLLLPSNLPESGSFPMSQFFASGGQSIGTSASASVFSKIIQNWFPLGLTGLISLQSKGLSRVFSNTTDQSIDFLALSFLYDPTLISIHD